MYKDTKAMAAILTKLNSQYISIFFRAFNTPSACLSAATWSATIDKFQQAHNTLLKTDPVKNSQLAHQFVDLKDRVAFTKDLISMAIEEDDNSLKDYLSEYDINDLLIDIEAFKLNWALAKTEPSDAVITITAGAGGDDSCDWTRMLAKMYTNWANKKRFKCTVINTIHNDKVGYRRVSLHISAQNAYSWVKGETGVHRLVRISPFDSKRKRHTSFASVLVFPLDNISKPYDNGKGSAKQDIEIPPEDITIDVFKSSGPGGQHANKTESAVRITHHPTGIAVECQNERSQISNKTTCMRLLRGRLLKLQEDKEQEEKSRLRKELPENAWGSQMRSYIIHPYQIVKDNKTKEESSDIEGVINGDIDRFLISRLYMLCNEEETK